MQFKVIIAHKQGEMIPPFYLPVYEHQQMYALECWIFPLAPFVLFYRITSNMFWALWRDLVDYQRLTIKHLKKEL